MSALLTLLLSKVGAWLVGGLALLGALFAARQQGKAAGAERERAATEKQRAETAALVAAQKLEVAKAIAAAAAVQTDAVTDKHDADAKITMLPTGAANDELRRDWSRD